MRARSAQPEELVHRTFTTRESKYHRQIFATFHNVRRFAVIPGGNAALHTPSVLPN